MRILHADLTSAQRDDSRTPYVEIVFTSFDGATTRTYKTTDATNRILMAKQAEGRFDEDNRDVLGINDTDFPISAVIQIQDSDKSINVLDHKGYKVRIGWGFNTDSGNKKSDSPPLIVIEQRSISFEGSLVVEFYCMSIFDLVRFGWQKQTASNNIHYDGNVSVRHLMMDIFGGRRAFAVLVEDQSLGTFEDFTAEALSPSDDSNLGVDDVFILPSGAAEADNDSFTIGHPDQFDIISIDLTVLGVKGAGAAAITWEYVSAVDGGLAPTAWTSLSNVVDNTSEFTAGELKTIYFDLPSNWELAIIDGKPASTGYYYVRARLTSGNYATTNPKASKLMVNSRHIGISLDTSTAGQGDDRTPKVAFALRADLIAIVQKLLGETLLALTVEDDGFHLKFKDNSIGSIDYTYRVPETAPSTDHAFFVGALRERPIVPNTITYINYNPGEVIDVTGATANNAASVASLGIIADVRISKDLATTQQKADDLGTDAIKRLLRDAVQATIEVPMNCAQEVWDVVQVLDNRSGQAYTTILSQLLRTYRPGFYRLQMFSGGAISASGILSSPGKGIDIPPFPEPEPEPDPIDDPPPDIDPPPDVDPPSNPPTKKQKRTPHKFTIPRDPIVEVDKEAEGELDTEDGDDGPRGDPRRFRGEPSGGRDFERESFEAVLRDLAERQRQIGIRAANLREGSLTTQDRGGGEGAGRSGLDPGENLRTQDRGGGLGQPIQGELARQEREREAARMRAAIIDPSVEGTPSPEFGRVPVLTPTQRGLQFRVPPPPRPRIREDKPDRPLGGLRPGRRRTGNRLQRQLARRREARRLRRAARA